MKQLLCEGIGIRGSEQSGEYWPTLPEVVISLGVWAMGFFVLTVLYKIAVSVKEEVVA